MEISPVIFGSTGMIGLGVLYECLESPLVKKVLVINRKPGGIVHPKLEEIILEDVSALEGHEARLASYDSCFFCLGVSALGMSEAEYTKVTHDLTLKVARKLLEIKKDYTFIYVSGQGTDSSEKGKMMWARVKGRTENDLLALPFKASYMFRPGFIQPLKGIRSRTRVYNMIYAVFKPLYFLFKSFKGSVTDTTTLGQAMIKAAAKGYDKKILSSRDINDLHLRSD